MLSSPRRDLIYDFLAPALLILTPFVSFTTYNRYSYAAPEFWICVAGLIAVALLFGLAGTIGGWPVRVVLTAGLLVLFVDVQTKWFAKSNPWRELNLLGVFLLALACSWGVRKHLSRIVTAVFATMLVFTVVLERMQDLIPEAPPPAAIDHPKPRSPGTPIFVHLILDEYIGTEGIPADVPQGREMRTDVRDFFEKYGFRLFGNAYSRYASTYNSIPNLVNFSSEPVDGAFTSGDHPYVLMKSEYFARMHKSGYHIHVYGSEYIDFCEMLREYIVRCHQTSISGIKSIEQLDLTLKEKVILIYQIYARRSHLQVAMDEEYRRLRERIRWSGLTLPEWWFKDARLGPAPSMPLFDRITADVAKSSPADLFFVYLPIPHYPFIYDSMCNLYPATNWERSVDFPPKMNDRQSRARRYGRYFEQVKCLHRKLDAMFQAWKRVGIFDRLVIVVHGDHGSKIREHAERELSRADYVDTFSTLFAVRQPGLPAGYDRRVAAIPELLEEVVARQTGDHRPYTEPNPNPYVFLYAGRGKPMIRQPLPAFDGR